jgi:hypothetical protein
MDGPIFSLLFEQMFLNFKMYCQDDTGKKLKMIMQLLGPNGLIHK